MTQWFLYLLYGVCLIFDTWLAITHFRSCTIVSCMLVGCTLRKKIPELQSKPLLAIYMSYIIHIVTFWYYRQWQWTKAEYLTLVCNLRERFSWHLWCWSLIPMLVLLLLVYRVSQADSNIIWLYYWKEFSKYQAYLVNWKVYWRPTTDHRKEIPDLPIPPHTIATSISHWAPIGVFGFFPTTHTEMDTYSICYYLCDSPNKWWRILSVFKIIHRLQ